MELISQYDKLNYEDFKRIKFDRELPRHLDYSIDGEGLFTLDEKDAPGCDSLINTLKSWDRKSSADSKGAALFAIAYYYVVDRSQKDWTNIQKLDKQQCVEAYQFMKDYLIKNFGRTDITLGDYQRLVRGDKAIPLPGLPDVIASMESEPWKNGQVRGRQGDSYIELVRFTKDGPTIESINCYGASNKPGNKHYEDQMELFVAQKTKPMSLKKEDVYKNAEKIYHPG